MITTDSLSTFGIVAASRVLIVMPHPDDEAIFCGGFIHKLTTEHISTSIPTASMATPITSPSAISRNASSAGPSSYCTSLSHLSIICQNPPNPSDPMWNFSQFMGPIGTVLKTFVFFLINHMTANEFFAWGN